MGSRRYRAIWHLHYTDWGDQGCPHSVAHYLGFLEELRSVRQHTLDDIPPGHNKNPPVLVHCTAGVGRTGLTILSDLLLYTLDHNQVKLTIHLLIQSDLLFFWNINRYFCRTENVIGYRSWMYLVLSHCWDTNGLTLYKQWPSTGLYTRCSFIISSKRDWYENPYLKHVVPQVQTIPYHAHIHIYIT